MLKRVAWPLPDARFRGVRPGGTWAWHGCGSSGSVAMLAPLLLQLIHEVLRMRQYGGGDGTAAEMPWKSCGRSRGGGWGGGGEMGGWLSEHGCRAESESATGTVWHACTHQRRAGPVCGQESVLVCLPPWGFLSVLCRTVKKPGQAGGRGGGGCAKAGFACDLPGAVQAS